MIQHPVSSIQYPAPGITQSFIEFYSFKTNGWINAPLPSTSHAANRIHFLQVVAQ